MSAVWWVALLLLSASSPASPGQVHIERNQDVLVVEMNDAPLGEVLTAIEKELGVQVRRVGVLETRVTGRIEGKKVADILKQLLTQRASFFLKSSSQPEKSPSEIEYVVVIGSMPTAASVKQQAQGPNVVTVDSSSDSHVQARMAQGVANVEKSEYQKSKQTSEDAAAAAQAVHQAELVQRLQTLRQVGRLQSLRHAAGTASIHQIGNTFSLEKAYEHYLETGDPGPLIKADRERKALEAQQRVIQQQLMEAQGGVLVSPPARKPDP